MSESAEETPLHVVSLVAENVKRIRAVTVKPDGAVVLIGGRNAQGKSSVLDSIEMALGGGKTIPAEPVRHGARKARIQLDLGEFTVERTFTVKGTELVVKGKDGIAKASPQKLLDTLCAKVAFDPLAFSRMDPKDQDALLKKLAGLDFTTLDAARAKVFDQRTEVNREVKRLGALVDSAEEHRDAPKEPIDVAETAALLQSRVEHNAERAAALAKLERDREAVADQAKEIDARRERIRQLEAEIAKATEQLEEMTANVVRAEQELPEEASLVELQVTLKTAEATNAKVRANAERAKLVADLARAEEQAQTHTDTIESLDEERAEKLAAAEFPVEGLGFDESGPTFGGVPLAQASQAERLRVSVAIGAALNPRIKVLLLREAAFLDDDSLRLLAELAREKQLQLWVERVGNRDESAIIIEDGSVLEASSESAAE